MLPFLNEKIRQVNEPTPLKIPNQKMIRENWTIIIYHKSQNKQKQFLFTDTELKKLDFYDSVIERITICLIKYLKALVCVFSHFFMIEQRK